MSSTQLTIIAGVLLSIAFQYVPKLKDWYGRQPNQYQQLLMLGFVLGAALAVFGLSCAQLQIPGLDLSGLSCSQHGALDLVSGFIGAVVANQGTFMILPNPSKPS